MKTFERVCIEDYKTLERGKIYITSQPDEKATVMVFTQHWIPDVPMEIFSGAKEFTS